MGGVSAIPKTPWRRTYEVRTKSWQQKIYATLDTQHRAILIVSHINNIKDDLPESHPFSRLIGLRICRLDAVDLGDAIAEVDRVLKPVRQWIFWKTYLPSIRMIYPGEPKQRQKELGLVIANPKEQKKLLSFLRDALLTISDLN